MLFLNLLLLTFEKTIVIRPIPSIYIFIKFITNCKWAYAHWQYYVKNEQYVNIIT
jgi:hypothetical protein